MTDKTERIKYLLQQYAMQKSSADEEEELFGLIDEAQYEEGIKQKLMQMLQNNKTDDTFNKDEWKNVLQKILQSEKNDAAIHSKVKRLRWTRIAAAAVFIAAITTTAFYFFNHSGKKNMAVANIKSYKNDIAPGSNKAVLTLGNGSKILLDSAANGALAQQGKIIISKQNNNGLVYSGNNIDNEKEIFYNTLSTPVGGQYKVVLPDGTNVWLNAASSLKYPTAFTGKERNVELTGEAYFEVAHNAQMPFHVKVNNIDVQVLGTHFNINSYSDEPTVKTTLLEGAVKISTENKTAMLVPGQQAIINKSNEINVADNIDVDQITAWKNGNFYFRNDDITEIAKQLSRWYGADINIKEQISQHYTGIISMQNNISAVLKMLELAGGIHFEINGNKLTITSE